MSGHDFRSHGLEGATVCPGQTDHNRKKSPVESGAFSGVCSVLTPGVEPGAFHMLIKSSTHIPSTQGLLSRPCSGIGLQDELKKKDSQKPNRSFVERPFKNGADPMS